MPIARRRLSGLLLAATLVVACSSTAKKPSASTSSGPKAGGVLRVGTERLKSLDPAAALPTSQSQLLAVDLAFDGLTAQPAGADVAQPSLAASWKPSADLKVWTFTLRSDARFSSGRTITADDVRFSLERVAKQGESTLPGVRLEIITGYMDFVLGQTPSLAGLTSVDASTLQITLDRAFAPLPELLASPSYGVVPMENVLAAAPPFATAPVTSGPFSYAGTEGDVIKLVRATDRGAPLDGVELHGYDDSSKSYDDFAAGKLDFSFVPAAKADDAASRFGTGAFRPFQAELFYAFNLLDPTFADVRFRQAIVKAVDRAALVKAVYPGGADVLNGIVPAGVPGHVADPCGPSCSFDPASSKVLIQQLFNGAGIPPVNIDYYQGPEEEAVAGAIEASLAAVGIPTVKRPKPAAEYDQFATSGQAQLFRLGAVGVYASTEAYLAPLFFSGSRDNATGFTNADFDSLVAQAQATADPAARLKLEQQAEQTLMALVPIMPIAQFRTTAIVSSRVHDLELSVLGTFACERVWIDT